MCVEGGTQRRVQCTRGVYTANWGVCCRGRAEQHTWLLDCAASTLVCVSAVPSAAAAAPAVRDSLAEELLAERDDVAEARSKAQQAVEALQVGGVCVGGCTCVWMGWVGVGWGGRLVGCVPRLTLLTVLHNQLLYAYTTAAAAVCECPCTGRMCDTGQCTE